MALLQGPLAARVIRGLEQWRPDHHRVGRVLVPDLSLQLRPHLTALSHSSCTFLFVDSALSFLQETGRTDVASIRSAHPHPGTTERARV